MNFNDKISILHGVGATYEKRFNENGICTLGDLLYYFPRAYQNRGDVFKISDTPFDLYPHSYILTVGSEPKVAMIKRGMTLLKFKAFDESGSVNITYFNQNYLKDVFKIGSTFRFFGKLSRDKKTPSMTSPAYEPILPKKSLPPLVPVYPLFNGINQKLISKLISEVTDNIDSISKEFLPESILNRMNLCSLPFALKNIHTPPDENTLNAAIRRLSFDELFLFATSVSMIKSSANVFEAPKMSDTDISKYLNMLPYELTDAQARAIGEILTDLSGSEGEYVKAMNRIVVGDVGSGKTVCAAIAAYTVCKNGYQAAMMVPTEILAVQHYNSMKEDFHRLGYTCELLTGSTPAKEKRCILEKLKRGEIDFVIGTHALIQDTVEFSKLGLVITDEQHRFGVRQRARLAQKSKNAHVLVMSATPIPRTLSLMIYGDLDISLIDMMPPGRKRVDTFVVDESYRDRLNSFIRKQVNEGHQVYIVCPSVEEKSEDVLDFFDYNPFIIHDNECDGTQLKAAVPYAKELKESIFPDLSVEFIHGKLKGKEKDKIMMDFSEGKIDVLVSTTVIEVGVNVPNATLMIVENAERFGLSQLHQLRGRVGRGSDKSYCILVSSSKGEKSRERLDIMHTVYDGYTIAERDLRMRGPGDFFSQDPSIRQSGQMNFSLASSCTDTDLLLSAFECAREILNDDRYLIKEENILLRERLNISLRSNLKTIN
ncbi:MAG: ATP-dependent DNA helicase RecG [Clostridia bacterium]|nr:ATP-dependent DNA helicase RecG [Clostridia bacterium]